MVWGTNGGRKRWRFFEKDFPELNAAWADFKAGRKIVFLWGRVDFEDVFGSKRWITFRFVQRGHYIRNFLQYEEGNETSESPRANT